MAGQRLTDKSALAENTANDDQFLVVDTSDTTGSSAGTSKKINPKYVIQTDKITLNNGELQALSSTGKVLVAKASGYGIIPLSVQLFFDYGSDPQSGNVKVYVGYGEAGSPSTSYYWNYKDRVMRGISTDAVYTINYSSTTNVSHSTSTSGVDLIIYSDANFDSTDLTCDVYVTYQVFKF